MKLQFFGATRQVTGSRYYLDTGKARLLIDCGMFQERDFRDRNWEPGPLRPKKLDAMLLTHAHVDHCGLVPKLVQKGFHGPIFTTSASADLVELILFDSAKIQAEDAAYKQRRHRKENRKPKRPVEPLYTTKDVERTVRLLRPVQYEEPVEVCKGVTAVFHDAGHILGSAMIELQIRDGDRLRRVVFSGDIGQRDKPIVRDPAELTKADVIVMESTYGDRDHTTPLDDDVETQLAEVISSTVKQGGNVVIPVFAIERAQELVFHIARLRQAGKVPEVPVFLDSPMAADATSIFREHRECFDPETWKAVTSGESPFGFPGLTLVRSVEESKAISERDGPTIIMSTSGMCTAGRIKFHLRRNIVRPESTILFVGYQAQGTLGRIILEGRKEIRIHGRKLPVRAAIKRIRGFSAHADRSALMRWLGNFQEPPEQLFLTHGEEEEALSLAKHVREELGWNVSVPEFLETFDLG